MRKTNSRLLSVYLCVAALAFTGAALSVGAQTSETNEWTWMKGSSTSQSFGVYGTLGAPAPDNAPGGRSQPVSWTDSKGNLWLFGGYGFDSGVGHGYLNDLWEINPATNEWTWMGGGTTLPAALESPGTYGTLGVPAKGNVPPGRSGAVSWTDTSGNLWLFGGSYDAILTTGQIAYFNDMWKFNPTNNEWTWMAGSNTTGQSPVYGTLGTPSPGNIPGAGDSGINWTDNSGHFWLLNGGELWEFYPLTNQWAWMGGKNDGTCNRVYGELGIAAPGNSPGGRSDTVSWTDSQGNLWLFGGQGCDSGGNGGSLNDLWKYSPSTHEWAWLSGANTGNQAGVYGTLQTAAPGNVPGSRIGARGSIDNEGNLWVFGGVGNDSTNTVGYLNDLWEFHPSTNQWAWMDGGANVIGGCAILTNWCGQFGVYGTLETPSLGDTPGSRYDGVTWTDSKGNFWLFGGIGYDGYGVPGYQSDLWEFQPNTGNLPVAATPNISPGSGTYASWQTVTITDTTPSASISYLINGNTPASTYSGPITVASSETIEAIASASGFANSNVATAAYVADLPQAAAPTLSLASGTYATAQTLSISDATPGATIYYSIGTSPTTGSSVYTGPINISVPETAEAIAVADGYLNSSVATAAYNIGLNPSAEWAWMGGSAIVPCQPANICGEPGWYGTLHAPSAVNVPGGRWGAVTWIDGNGELWLFGGAGFDSVGANGYLNDLWMFNQLTGEWTWMSGSSKVACATSGICGQPGVYGTLGIASGESVPGSRSNAVGWADSKGNLWLFGGEGFAVDNTVGYLDDLWEFDTSSRQWIWMGGSNTIPCAYCAQRGVYGTLATPAARNVPGGRMEATNWTDRNGSFWLYGGYGEDANGAQCYLNDLWELDPVANQWSWRDGRQSCSNLAGGWPGVYGSLDDFGVANLPWSLITASGWVDSSNKFWLFGGVGTDIYGDSGYFNDMWEYDPSINEWAWTSAASAAGNFFGVYGAMGTWAAEDIPGPRWNAASWTDHNNNFWLFGGAGYDAKSVFNNLNDLWEFKPSLNEWAWMGGNSQSGQPGSYGAWGVQAPANIPGARGRSATWTDKDGNLWLFGGTGYDAARGNEFLNDMWRFGISGPPSAIPPVPSVTPTFSPVAGTYNGPQSLTISAAPGATIYFTTNGTIPNSGSAVYAGPIPILLSQTFNAVAVSSGNSLSAVATAAYTISNPQTATPSFSVPQGTYNTAQTVTISDATAAAAIYYTTDGTTPTTSSQVYTAPITISATVTLEAIAIANGYSTSAVASATYTINLPPSFAITGTSVMLYPGVTTGNTSTITVTPTNGFTGTINLSCAITPRAASDPATCSIPGSITISGTAAQTTTLTVTTTAATSALNPSRHFFWPSAGSLALACILLVGIPARRRRWQQSLIGLLLLLISLTGGVFACGGGGNGGGGGGGGGNSGTTAGTYTITVTGVSGATTQSGDVALTVR